MKRVLFVSIVVVLVALVIARSVPENKDDTHPERGGIEKRAVGGAKGKPPAGGGKPPGKPAAGGKKPPAGGKKPPAAVGKPPAAGKKPPAAGKKPPAAGKKPPAAGKKPPAAGGKPPSAGKKPPAAGGKPSSAGKKPPAAGGKPSSAGKKPPAAGGKPSSAGKKPPPVGGKPPAAGGQSASAGNAPQSSATVVESAESQDMICEHDCPEFAPEDYGEDREYDTADPVIVDSVEDDAGPIYESVICENCKKIEDVDIVHDDDYSDEMVEDDLCVEGAEVSSDGTDYGAYQVEEDY